ncbi:hypothetical protein HPB50_011183 [Hyalomma asiaticum]|uniref:Uncharacterized protein n=1 Tax=Hyalomma asiaticum TaxID=266040 RepID=A0ACB7RPF1_HYAAI|nr:hypothetical protein HPB50_011183 [Hyalomma asiaticum]
MRAAKQAGQVEELRGQLALSRETHALVVPRPPSVTPPPPATYAAVAAGPGVAPPVQSDGHAPPTSLLQWQCVSSESAPRILGQEHIMLLSPLVPTTSAANDVSKIIKANTDPTKEKIGEIVIRKTRHGLTIPSNDQQSIVRLRTL